jgi:hypothetical protein
MQLLHLHSGGCMLHHRRPVVQNISLIYWMFCPLITLRISSVPNKVRNMLESIALTEPIDLCPLVVENLLETELTNEGVARDTGRARRR